MRFRYLNAIKRSASVSKNSGYKATRARFVYSHLENKRIRPLVSDDGYKVILHLANSQDGILFRRYVIKLIKLKMFRPIQNNLFFIVTCVYMSPEKRRVVKSCLSTTKTLNLNNNSTLSTQLECIISDHT